MWLSVVVFDLANTFQGDSYTSSAAPRVRADGAISCRRVAKGYLTNEQSERVRYSVEHEK